MGRTPLVLLDQAFLCVQHADLEDELEEDGARATGDHGPDDGGGSPRRNRYDDFGDMSDEMDDFIVDRGDGDRRRARRRRDARMAEAAGLSTAAVQVGPSDKQPTVSAFTAAAAEMPEVVSALIAANTCQQ